MVRPRSPGEGGGGETEVRKLQTSASETHGRRAPLIKTHYFRYMEDVPALLSHCFGKRRVSSELASFFFLM